MRTTHPIHPHNRTVKQPNYRNQSSRVLLCHVPPSSHPNRRLLLLLLHHRLLFHRVRPVFVFDGATPALKRHTNIARRRRREAQQGVLRKTAEKLLIAQMKKQVRANVWLLCTFVFDDVDCAWYALHVTGK